MANCINGHETHPDFPYCPSCGAALGVTVQADATPRAAASNPARRTRSNKWLLAAIASAMLAAVCAGFVVRLDQASTSARLQAAANNPYGTFNDFAAAAGFEQETSIASGCYEAGELDAQILCSLFVQAEDAARIDRLTAQGDMAGLGFWLFSGAAVVFFVVGWVQRRRASEPQVGSP